MLLKKKKNKEIENKIPKKTTENKGRSLKGVIVSDKMDKTVVVSVNQYKEHPKYKKRYSVSKKYKAHDEKNEYKTGDKVIIHECRPLSKDKKWEVIKKAWYKQKQN